jgi:glutathione S-transferase
MADAKPVLWHIPVSHYSEKVRWALAHKSVEHERRSPLPGAHMLVALRLTRGKQKTLPILRLDGETICDSTAIIGALERRFPEPPLYPEDPDDRRRALELEDFFDEELGPHIRLVAWHELRTDSERMGDLTTKMLPPPIRRLGPARRVGRGFGTAFVKLRYRADSVEAAVLGREKVRAALDRLERELDDVDGEYLSGDRFSVADLTAAALFYPLVNPPEGPGVLPHQLPPRFEEFREPLKERTGYRWVEEIYARHRDTTAGSSASRPGPAGPTNPRSPAPL